MNAPEKPPIAHPKPGLFVPPLSLEAANGFDALIDTRSPAEFALDHIPGAINLPVLSDAERAQVGTLYKQVSAFDARKLGAAIVARNIAAHLDTALRDKPRKWRPLVYCWRGGMRSGAMTQILKSVGWNALQLEGGYKAWRGQVIADLAVLPARFQYRVICGRTGSGKSRLLQALAAAGAQVLDLEQLAAHKGSVLGELPGAAQPSQKWFESRLWAALSGFDPARPVYVEAESKKVGALRVPQTLIEEMWRGRCFEIELPKTARIALLREEYAHFTEGTDALFARLDCLKELHSRKQIDAWKALALASDWDAFIDGMLDNHYDPAYQRSMFHNYRQAQHAERIAIGEVSADAFGRAAGLLIQIHDNPALAHEK